MEVENPALKDCKTEVAGHDLTCKTDQTVKQAAVKVKKVAVFLSVVQAIRKSIIKISPLIVMC